MTTVTQEPTKEQVLKDLLDYANEKAALEARRDGLIKRAWEAGVQMTHVAALLGLTRARCYQIKDQLV